ncbi:MAG: ABC transporter substrate-binding protein [Dehalococcoidia bacterium]
MIKLLRSKVWWVVAVALVAALIGAACGDDEEEELVSVNLASIPPFSVTTWPVVVADEQGFFEREGIDVNITFTFDGGLFLAGGQVDIINDGADSGLIGFAQGKDVIFVAPLAQTVTDGLLVSTDITSVADLEGKTLRVVGFGTDEFLARRFIEENGLSPDAVNFVDIEDDGAALGQLDVGQIDGGMFDQGVLLEAEQTGQFNVLAKPDELGSFPWNVIQTTRGYAEDNPDVVVGFIRAVQDAMRFILDPNNKESVIEAVLATGEGLEREEVELTYESAAGFGLYTFDPLSVDDVAPALEALIFLEEDVSGIDLNELIDNSFLEQATQ